MIRKIEISEIPFVSEYVWKVYEDESTRTTPPFKDKNSVKQHFVRETQYSNSFLLGVYEKNLLEGVILIIEDQADLSINMQGPYIKNTEKYHEIASEILSYVKIRFREYKCYVGTTKTNIISQSFFESNQFICTEDAIQMRITKAQLGAMESSNQVISLPDERLKEYHYFHNLYFPDYYWQFERIQEVRDRWKIHILVNQDKIVGCVFSMKQEAQSVEIYGCHILEAYKTKELMSELLCCNVWDWFDYGITEVLYFAPNGIESESAEEIGFQGYDTYLGYFTKRLVEEKEHIQSEHFCLYYSAEDKDIIFSFKEILEGTYQSIVNEHQDFLILDKQIIQLYLCESADEYIVRTNKIPEEYQSWMVGNSDFKTRTIYILSPKAVKGFSQRDMEQVAIHELIHIIFDAGTSTFENEAWLAEGIALLYAGQIVTQNISTIDYPSIAAISGKCVQGETPDQFVENGGYDYAGVYVWYYIKNYGFHDFVNAYMNLVNLENRIFEGYEKEAINAYFENY